MKVTLWEAPGSQLLAEWLIAHSDLRFLPSIQKRRLYQSDAVSPSEFFRMPARIKDILYLDSPDLIISIDDIPVLSLEISQEAGTGHNAFQRFSRIAAAVENGCGAIYIYPEAAWVSRDNSQSWDRINPLVFKTLEQVMNVYDVPAFLYYFPTEFAGDMKASPSSAAGPKGHLFDANPSFVMCPDSNAPQMKEVFEHVNLTLAVAQHNHPSQVGDQVLKHPWSRRKRNWMLTEWATKHQNRTWSPETATVVVDTSELLKLLQEYDGSASHFGELLPEREKTLIYQVDAKFRGDPYTGCLAALDYLLCRTGKSYENRRMNLVLCWGRVVQGADGISIQGKASVEDYVNEIQSLYRDPSKVLLLQPYSRLAGKIPRYMMQARFGTTFTKKKELRIYAYFADAILFADGALWREA